MLREIVFSIVLFVIFHFKNHIFLLGVDGLSFRPIAIFNDLQFENWII